MGFLILMNNLGVNAIVQIIVPILYWVALAAGVAALIVRLTKSTYEKPLQQIAQAAQRVAGGDFSVYIPPIHAADKKDYMDDMIMNFNKMVAELGSTETLKTDFFSNVSHEIKTPLAVIQNTATLLNDGTLTEEQAEYVNTIGRYSRRLNDLIFNILKLNKLEKQNIQPVAEPYNLCEQLVECALLFEDWWETKEIEFEADIEERAIITADGSLLELVWNNLLSNAFKFTPSGGAVTLRQTSAQNEVIVEVTDTDCGMDEKTMEHIFNKFYQGDTSHSTEGNGLGLALVLRILRMVGGDISVTSVPDKGSTFTVKLPMKERVTDG